MPAMGVSGKGCERICVPPPSHDLIAGHGNERFPCVIRGLAPIHVVASLSTPSWNQIQSFLKQMAQLREMAGRVSHPREQHEDQDPGRCCLH